MATLTSLRGQSLRRFARHYLEMIVAMLVGMVVLGPVESLLLNPLGWADLRADPEVNPLIMATNMTVGMGLWMGYRRHSWAAIRQMAWAMYGSFVVFFPLLWLGILSDMGLMVVGHVVMPFAMLAAMLWRLDEYTGHQASTAPSASAATSAVEPGTGS
jgi:hypothetical protein